MYLVTSDPLFHAGQRQFSSLHYPTFDQLILQTPPKRVRTAASYALLWELSSWLIEYV